MNIVLKSIDEILQQKKFTKVQKKILENTKKFSKKNDIKIIYKNIDFLVLKLETKNINLKNIEQNIKKVYPYNELLETKIWIEKIYNTLKIFDKFVLINAWLAFSEQKKLYNIYDFDKNKIWQLTLINKEKLKSNNNVINSLELSWLFFKCYDEYLDNFLTYFWINCEKQNIIKRLDYCVDFKWIEVFQFQEYLKDLQKKSKIVNWLTATDIKELKENNINIKHWRQEIYMNFISNHNDLKIYDKILDILQNYMKRKVNWENPYRDYLESDFPITRIELKKKKFNNLRDNSIKWVFQNIEALFFDYLKRYFIVDLSFYNWINKTLNWKKIFLAKEEKTKKFFHSLNMFLAYWKNLEEMLWETEFYKLLYKNYPKLESLKELELLDNFEIYDLLDKLFPKNEK